MQKDEVISDAYVNELKAALNQRTQEIAVVNSVQEALAKKMEIQEIYDLVGDRIRILFDAQGVIIASFDKENAVEIFKYAIENGERLYPNSRALDKLRQNLISTGQKIVINNEEEAHEWVGKKVVPGTKNMMSGTFVPLVIAGKTTGYISIQNVDKEYAFSQDNIRLLETLANSMGVALENARLFDETSRLLKETEQGKAELAVINSVQEGLVREMDIQGIYKMVGNRIRELFNAQVVLIATFDHNKKLEIFNFHIERGEISYPAPRTFDKIRQHLITTGQNILINENVNKAIGEFGLRVVPGTEMPKSLLFMPMKVGDKVVGYVSLQNIDQENAFSFSDVRLLSTLANSMSVALQNAKLFDETTRLLKETEQQKGELAVINSVQEGLAKALDMQSIYDLVGNRIRDLFDAQVVGIATFDHGNETEHIHYLIEKGERYYPAPRAQNMLRKHLIQSKEKILINKNFEVVAGAFGVKAVPGTQQPKSALYVPLVIGDKVTGYTSLQNLDKEGAFSDSDVRLLETLANTMGVALENARLFDETNRLLKETEQQKAELGVINSVQDGLSKELDIQAIYDLVGERIRELFNAQAVIIATFDHDAATEHFKYIIEDGQRFYSKARPYDKLRQHIIMSRQKIVINNNYQEAYAKFGLRTLPGTNQTKSGVFVPLVIGDKVNSYISLQNNEIENAFSESDVRLLETLANSMSVALENARLFDETNRLLKETEQRTAELAVINSVQEGLAHELDMQGIYELVGDRLCSLFPDTQTLVIRTFDHNTEKDHFYYAIEKGVRFQIEPRPFNWTSKELIATKKPLDIRTNYLETAQSHGGTGVTTGQSPKSAVFVPMLVGETVKGSVSLQNVDKEEAFTDSDVRLLTTITNSMSVALENARLFDETTHLLAEAKQRAAELSTVNSISKALASQLNADELIQFVGNQMKELFNANIVYLALLNPKTRVINFAYQFGEVMPSRIIGEGLTSKIILTGEPLLINEKFDEKREELGIQKMGAAAASYLGVPIPVGDEIVGVLSVQSTEQENRFNENDLRLISTIAASVGVALNNATLFEDVKQAKSEAESASRAAEKANEAKSAFLSTVSHELRTPLTSVLGFAKIIRKRLDEKIFPLVNRTDQKVDKIVNQISENLGVVISEGERLTHLINDVLDLAKIEAGKMEWNVEVVSMSDVAERAIAATMSLFDQKGLALKKDIEKNLPPFSGDRDKLIQVIINLISNSVKFTDKGSITLKVYKKKDEIVVGITDTGIGIAVEDHAAVFEQFKQVGGDTLTDKPKGTGLGLPICKEIVEHHGGRIWLESKPGKGSTFSFALPVIKDQPIFKPLGLQHLVEQLRHQMTRSHLDGISKNSRILVVDDDESIRSLLNQELTDAGYLVEEAGNGKLALDAVRREKPDLIILDIMMPEMNGFDVAAILKNDPQTMDIPIIVLSIVQDKVRGFRIGVDRYLTKPIDTAQLFSEVGMLLEQGKSSKKVMVVDEDSAAVKSLTDVLVEKGYSVVESNGKQLVQNAVLSKPDIIILNSIHSDKQEVIKTLRFENGLENVLFLIYQ